jgi:hypothetical protein
MPFIQIFAIRFPCGELPASGSADQAQMAEDYVRHVAQTYLNIGGEDARLNSVNLSKFLATTYDQILEVF